MNKNIIYVSLIKSISDPRATKILGSLKKQYPTHQYHLVASEDTQNTPQEKSYHLHPLNKTLNRRRKRKEALSICKELNANIIIFNNIDFFWYYFLNFYNRIFIYDIRENYSKNIRFQKHYIGIKKKLLPYLINSLEYLATKLTYGEILAEKCYKKELRHRISNNHTILENKAFSRTSSPTKSRKKFLISGTLSLEYGTLDAIKWFIKYHELFNDSKLTLIGKASSTDLEKKIKAMTSIKPSAFSINTSINTIPYEDIKTEIKKADICLLPYQTNHCFDNKIPTKLYEYICAEKIIFSQKKHLYNSLLEDKKNSLTINFQDTNSLTLQQIHMNSNTLLANKPLKEHLWESEENKLFRFFDKLLR